MGDEWKTILERHRYAVILGEARSGKTYELCSQALALHSQQCFAFYATLTDIKEFGLPDALSEDQKHAFERWGKSSEEAYFFIDSVDEARQLVNVRLGQAVRQLCNGVGEAFRRMRLILSCRVSDWRPQHDLLELYMSLGLKPHDRVRKSSPSENIGIYQLLSLDHNQVDMIAKHELDSNQNNFASFMKEFSSAQLWMFAGRPADLRWLISYWKRYRKFGSFTQIIAENVEQKIKEGNPEYRSKRPLNLSRARSAAQRLAAGLLFGGKTTIALDIDSAMAAAKSGSVRQPSIANACDPEAVLDDFQPDEIADLLSRPLFDEATYGRVRFHHRTVMEYLAAKWLSELCQRGLPPSELLKVLFADVNGRRVLPRSRAAVAAWLAPEISEIRSSLITDAPEAILCHADPATLPVAELAKALKNCAVRLHARRRAYTLLEEGDFALCRLAITRLEDTTYELLEKYRSSSDLCVFLLKLISVAKWKKRCDLIGDLAISDEVEERIRIYAIRSIEELQDSTQIARLAYFAQHAPSITNELRALLCKVLYPQAFTIQDCLKLLAPTIENRASSGAEAALGYQLPHSCLEADRKALLDGLLDIANRIMQKRTTNILGSSHSWLYRGISRVVIDMADKDYVDETTLDIIKPALVFLEHGISKRKFYDRAELENLLTKRRSVAHAFLLHLYTSKPKWVYVYGEFPVMHTQLFAFKAQDIPWLLDQVRNNHNESIRRLSLFTAITIFFNNVLDDAIISEMESLADIDAKAISAITNARQAKLAKSKHEQEEREREAHAKEQQAQDEASRAAAEIRARAKAQSFLECTQSGLLNEEEARQLLLGVIHQLIRDLVNEILTSLFDRYKSVVGRVFLELIAQEFSATKSEPPWTLSYIVYMPVELRQTIAPLVLDRLLLHEPLQKETLRNSLLVLLTTPTSVQDPRLMSLASDRAVSAATDEHQVLWLVAWLCLDGEPAWGFVEKRLTSLDKPALFVTTLASTLHTIFDRNSVLKESFIPASKGFWQKPELIGRMFRTLHKYIPNDDKDDDDRMKTLGPNHDAREFRDNLTSRLWKIASEQSLQVLNALASDAELSIYKDYFLRLRDLSISDIAEAAQSAWTAVDMKIFEDKFTRPPTTAKELFELVRSRLNDIRLRTERGADFSIRTTLCRTKDEIELQNWLADELEKRKPSYYCVVREGEVADGKNPDIHIVSNSCPDRISIEIKPTDRKGYSFNYFEQKALKKQLIGQYLRAGNASFGILVLIHTKKRTWRKSGSAKTHISSFPELINTLNKKAVRLAIEGGFDEVCVFGIDCTN